MEERELHANKLKFFIDQESYVSDIYISEEELKARLAAFKKEKIFYIAILLPALSDGKSPLDRAIEANKQRFVEIMLNSIQELDDYNVSKAIKSNFPKLFDMKIKSFERYLETCYFQTSQMVNLTRLNLKSDKILLLHKNTSILTADFFRKYSIVVKAEKDALKQKKKEELKKAKEAAALLKENQKRLEMLQNGQYVEDNAKTQDEKNK